MPIICFEGASAVGKTTTSIALRKQHGARPVPEVNQLFSRPENEPVEWYFERQVERWQSARRHASSGALVVLDGDPFQPLWYNWAYDFAGRQKLDFMERFYRSAMRDDLLDFPRRYFIFGTSETELRKRRAGDTARRRRHFETHLRMIAPMRRYFEAMQLFSPGRVLFLEAETIASNVEFIAGNSSDSSLSKPPDSEFLLDKMISWLRENKA